MCKLAVAVVKTAGVMVGTVDLVVSAYHFIETGNGIGGQRYGLRRCDEKLITIMLFPYKVIGHFYNAIMSRFSVKL